MQKDANIHCGHWERTRQRVLKFGIEDLNDVDVLECILQFVFKRADTNEIARRLLDKYRDLPTIAKSSERDLKLIVGIGDTAARKLRVMFKCMDYAKMRESDMVYKSTKTTATAYDMIRTEFGNLKKENIFVYYLDAENNVLYHTKLDNGSKENEVIIDYYAIQNQAETYHAEKVILAHNHPTGDIKPSVEDFQCTSRLYYVLRGAGIRLIDHIICGNDKYFSFYSSKVLPYIAELYDQEVLSLATDGTFK